MNTKAVRLYGKKDLRLEEFELPAIQPNIKWPGTMNGLGAPGYSYPHIGGDATSIIIPNEVMEQGSIYWQTQNQFKSRRIIDYN